MCIIIDNNKFGDLNSPDGEPIIKWLDKGGKIVFGVGGDFEETPAFALDLLLDFEEKGKAKSYLWERDKVRADAEALKRRQPKIKSNDAHILALAQASGARLLFSGDKALHNDFKNPDIIDPPRGKVYQGEQHQRLLASSVCKKAA